MMKNVTNSERPMMIWLAGVPCNERAVRSKESTMTMRVKLVIKRIIEGARVKSVMANSTLMPTSTSCPCAPVSTPKFRRKGTELVALFETLANELLWAWSRAAPGQFKIKTSNQKRTIPASRGRQHEGAVGWMTKAGRGSLVIVQLWAPQPEVSETVLDDGPGTP